ncbi:ABC transporter ATP-binding protein [Aestuariispira insulae]|uniref:Nucleoside ABC transporter ATP-binding protein n=1 Tax=Aestuariispira insulae TaxID=1461337 RepID=A0A3D9HY72_9PROT|nr:ABC transporter ATP-binding protein [Aestuariispira insulae]RED53856.1 nucleoside ABC transporter ATP-binding protein [Aestuariispira insulae]
MSNSVHNAGSVPRLALKGVTKQYPGCLANDSVDLTIMPGEIHALLGENGAGKSTLVKYIYGVVKADAGEMRWNGELVDVVNPNFARRLGVGMVFQHFSLFDSMTVEENIALGIAPELAGPGLDKRIREVSEQYGLPLDPKRHVFSLSVGERQRIEIVRCLLQDPKLLIMDEPTSVLTPQEVERMFVTLRRLSDEGVSILYISHKLDEIKALCHNATIMRAGKVVGDCDPQVETPKTMAEMMIGTHLVAPQRDETMVEGDALLVVDGLSMEAEDEHGTSLKNISMEVRSGEILGIAGIAGNGQTELMDALSGEVLADHENVVLINGELAGRMGAGERRDLGVGFVPEERLGHGAVPDMSLWENAFLSGMKRKDLLIKGFMDVVKTVDYAEKIVKNFKVKTSGVDHNASSLSGGNLQKFIMGREIMQDPTVMIALQPTWGVDAGAAAAIHQALFDLAKKGAAVLVISQDLDELFAVSSRIAVIAEGKLSPAKPVEDLTVEQIGLMMGGLHGMPDEGGQKRVA